MSFLFGSESDYGGSPLTPNRSLDRYSAVRHGEDNILSAFIFLLISYFSFVLAVARYASNEKQSAQQSKEMCSEFNDRFGLNKGLF